MALPVTSTPARNVVIPPTGLAYRYSRYEVGYKQAKPYDLYLDYSAHHLFRYSGNRSATSNFDSNYTPWFIQNLTSDVYQSWNESYLEAARQRAVAKFNNLKGAQASLGVAMGEAKESVKMITSRLTQLYKAANAIRKFRFYEAAEVMGLVKNKRPRKALLKGKKLRWTKNPITKKYYPRPVKTSLGRKSAHAFSRHWLEYSFGWAPLARDLVEAMEVLNEPLHYRTQLQAVGGIDSTYTRTDPAIRPGQAVTVMKYRCLVSGLLSVSNPNRNLMGRLGLVNLAAVAWDLVPFSFLVGMVVNVNAYLRQFTEYYGVQVFQAYYTEYVTGRTDYSWYSGPATDAGSHGSYSVRRKVGSLPNLKLGLKPAFKLSVSGAVNISSLLVSLFTDGRALPVGVRR